jgi:hypothetical protein
MERVILHETEEEQLRWWGRVMRILAAELLNWLQNATHRGKEV